MQLAGPRRPEGDKLDGMFRALLLLFLAAACAAQTLDGVWIGSLRKDSNPAALVFVFENATHATVNSIEMGTTNDLSNITVDADKVRFEVKRVSGRFEGTLDHDGKKLAGVWTQPGFREALVLARTDRTAVMDPALEGIDARVPHPPTVVRADGRDWLFYEVHITNWSSEEMTLLGLDVLIDDDEVHIDADLLQKIAVAGGTKLQPGVRSIVMIPVSGGPFPNTIRHRVTFQLAGESKPRSTECAPVQVLRGPVRLGPPVGAGSWRMAAGPDSDMHHRGAILAYRGRATISQRFAFDIFVETSEEPDHTANESYLSYGAPLIAVADGTVASVVDGLPDNPPRALLATVPLTPDRMYGNRVTLDIGGGRYVTYAHMKSGLRVKAGDPVRRGQVLGAIGSSGRSGAPHLHFQVTDGPDPIASEGVPFIFESFTHEGTKYTGEMPLNRWVVSFPK
jgi:murein DD-endopeptidase MepM/ murein hydrolase activator NlpD